MERDLVGSEDDGVPRSDGGDESADEEQADVLHGRISAVVAALEDMGELEKVGGESAAEQSDVRYRRVPPPPAAVHQRQRRRRPRAVEPSRAERMEEPLVDLRVMKPENEEKQLQSSLEQLPIHPAARTVGMLGSGCDDAMMR